MKKALCIILAAAIMLTIIAVVPFTAEAKKSGDFVYTVTDGKAEITTYTGTASELEIPSEFSSVPVKSIGNDAFKSNNNLTKVIIPDSVEQIGNNAFQFCYSLESISIPDSVVSVGYSAFESTVWYSKQHSGVVYVGKVAYKVKGTCPDVVMLKDGTKSIAPYAFNGCNDLTSMIIPDSVVSIGIFAFGDCRTLKSVKISNSVDYINEYVFYNCVSLESVTIPNSVTFIANEAFYNCVSLESVIVPLSVERIRSSAFSGCVSLESVTILNSNMDLSIWDDPFYDCSSLTIYGYQGSTAEQYASNKKYTFISLDGEPPTQSNTEKPTEPFTNPIFGDIDGDGQVTVSDATLIQQYAAQMESPYPIGKPIE